jgi:8-oxo-dGTP pyrophosphatase MutT (NUDIX family)
MMALPSFEQRVSAVVDGDHQVWSTPIARRAATVALLRDGGAGLEVYLFRRAATMAAAADMHVFPGGAVEPGDGPADDPGTMRTAAVRELAEETGVELPDGGAGLVRFSRWVTPEIFPHRHDTDFFACRLPDGQYPELVGTEGTTADWSSPQDALRQAAAGLLGLLPPTWAALHLLAAFDSVGAALAGLEGHQVPALMPVPVRTATGYEWELRDCLAGRLITDPSEYGLPPDWRPVPTMGGQK